MHNLRCNQNFIITELPEIKVFWLFEISWSKMVFSLLAKTLATGLYIILHSKLGHNSFSDYGFGNFGIKTMVVWLRWGVITTLLRILSHSSVTYFPMIDHKDWKNAALIPSSFRDLVGCIESKASLISLTEKGCNTRVFCLSVTH